MRAPAPVLALTCAVLLPVIASCGAPAAAAQEVRGTAKPVPRADPRPLARADTAFGLAMLGAVCAKGSHANAVLSPSSLASGLGMVRLGARGATARAMDRTLHLPSGDLLPGLHARTAALRALNGKDVALRVTDRIWADEHVPTNAGYLNDLATGYDAGLRKLDISGAPDAARRTVNDRIADDTAGRIRDLLPPDSVTSSTGWILTDAVHLKARWAAPFEAESTLPKPFAAATGTVQATTMAATGLFAYARAGGWTAVDLPYRGGRASMTALLPAAGAKECALPDAATLARVTAGLRPTSVELALPKADLSATLDAESLLKELGMGVAFGDGADFTGISPKAGALQFVRHAAALKVDEDGTEGAAATAVGVDVAGAVAPPRGKVRVAFDRPYLLLVRDRTTGEPLFLARVADPTKR
ncbi:serpin family protein [Actinomadura parmotrematis]|uniref:Serpin family protein n=1 Tax=Actinomadura parmotrematis TaxID=2864039 RepID=A0ABS7FYI3_9ACTN|nr:serpin family protein [Actinomadura parmotrematis]MBW8485503.1 serpin family protein [Actinomadura parmotrematis]